MEGQIIINKSLDFVRERVTEELKAQLVDLQQYTRRYLVVSAGVRTGIDERTTVEAILKEAASNTKMEDVGKLHRVGPPKQGKQDIIVRFKSHTAKENFFKRKKCIKNIKVRPSLAPERRKLLESYYHARLL